MTMIVPAGNKNVNWSPKETELVKTAATSVSQDIEDTNPLYVAAKKYLEAQFEADKCEKCKKNPCECPEVKEEKKARIADEKSPVIDVGSPRVEEVAQTTDEKIEVAVEKIDEAVVEIKDAAGIEEKIEDQVEIEVEEIGAPSVEIPGKEKSNDDIIVKSEPAVECACADTKGKEVKEAKKEDKKEDKKKEKAEEKKEEVKMDKSAEVEEEFCKFAKLSPANKAKLANYWTNMLGFPKDYVNLMTKDYEK